MILQVPELADGGYWYVCFAVTVEGETRPDFPYSGWCAWYRTIDNVLYAVVRTPDPVGAVSTIAGLKSVDVLSDWPVRPHGRVGGL